MDLAIQRCCVTSVYLKQYETSTDAVLKTLGVGIVDIKKFNCCGYPLKNFDSKAYILSSARNLALAKEKGLDIMTLCNCCYGNLKHVNHLLNEDSSLKDDISATLNKEGLVYDCNVEIKHVIEIIYRDIGIEHVRELINRKLDGLKIAIHYGCHILRPRQLVQFNEPGTIFIFDQLIEATGADIISWPAQSDCCGSPMLGIDDELSMDLTHKKMKDARQ